MSFWNWATVLLAILVAGELFAAQSTSDHVISPSELHRTVRNSAQARQDNLARLDKLVGPARKLCEGMRIDPTKVSYALAMLSDEELARLARQSETIENDLAAGGPSTLLLLAILLALILVVLVAVKVG
jgi:hypothetical protein